MIIKVFSFALLLIMLVWALAGCLPQDSVAAKVTIEGKEYPEPKTSSKYWRPSEDLKGPSKGLLTAFSGPKRAL